MFIISLEYIILVHIIFPWKWYGSISILDKLRAEKSFGFVHCDLLYPYYTKKKIISFLSLSRRQEFSMSAFDPCVWSKGADLFKTTVICRVSSLRI